MEQNCDLRCGENMDCCRKLGKKPRPCRPCTIDDFSSGELEQCDIEQVCRNESIFGNDLIALTNEDIEALKNGKVLYQINEYGLFLAYKKGE